VVRSFDERGEGKDSWEVMEGRARNNSNILRFQHRLLDIARMKLSSIGYTHTMNRYWLRHIDQGNEVEASCHTILDECKAMMYPAIP